jgi:thioredoxin reductase
MKTAHPNSSRSSSTLTGWNQLSTKGTEMRENVLTPENPATENQQVVSGDPFHFTARTSAAEAHLHRLTRRSIAATKPVQVAIVGAGPYGLSIAAHLRACGIRFRIFGRTMETWSTRMPANMLLKSEGFASNLYDPERQFTLKEFCRRHGLHYADVGVPVSVKTMVAYGRSFQEQLVPDLETRVVTTVEQAPNEFVLQLDNGEKVSVPRVIVAVGYTYFPYLPTGLDGLPPELLSHSSHQCDLGRFKGCDVTIIGGGASALDLAGLLHEVGAEVRLLTRRSSVVFNSEPAPRSIWDRIRSPMTQLGSGWRNVFFCDAPMLFRHLPKETRLGVLKNSFPPAGGWQMKDRVVGRVPMLLARALKNATSSGGRVHLDLLDEKGAHSEVVTSHVIAATGYRVDIGRLRFLGEGIRAHLHLEELAPVLSEDFESSIPGLYFVGLSSASHFGPVMRFVAGAGFTSRRIAKHLTRVARP